MYLGEQQRSEKGAEQLPLFLSNHAKSTGNGSPAQRGLIYYVLCFAEFRCASLIRFTMFCCASDCASDYTVFRCTSRPFRGWVPQITSILRLHSRRTIRGEIRKQKIACRANKQRI
jgi:hypothetical protein